MYFFAAVQFLLKELKWKLQYSSWYHLGESFLLTQSELPPSPSGSCRILPGPRATSQPMILSNTSDSGNTHMWHLTSSSAKASNFPLHRLMIHHLLLLMASYVESGSVKQQWPYIFPNSKSWFQETIPFPNIQQTRDRGKGVIGEQKSTTASITCSNVIW